jgi:hypothetical protein
MIVAVREVRGLMARLLLIGIRFDARTHPLDIPPSEQSARMHVVRETQRVFAGDQPRPRSGVTTMRSSVFSRLDRNLSYDRPRPARRIAERFSLLFLLSLAAFATLTTPPPIQSEHGVAPVVGGTPALHPSGSR